MDFGVGVCSSIIVTMATVFQNCPEVVKSCQRMPTQLLQERLGQRWRGIEDLPRLQSHVLSTILTLLLPAMLLIVPFQDHRCEDVGAGDVRTQAFRVSDLGSPMEARMRKGEEFRSGG